MTTAGLLAGAGTIVVLSSVALAIAGARGLPLAPRRQVDLSFRRSWIVAAVLGLVVLVFTGWVAAALAAAAATVFLPMLWQTGIDAQRRIDRLQALAGWTRRLADLISSGAVGSLDEALRRSAQTCPEAISPEITAMVTRMGPQGNEAALRQFAKDFADPAGDHVAMALMIRVRAGGSGSSRGGLKDVLTSLAADVDEQVRMRRQIQSARATSLSSIRLLVVLPIVVWVLMVLFARDYLDPYSTPDGQVGLFLVVGIFVFAMAWLFRLSQPVTGNRFLSDVDDGPSR